MDIPKALDIANSCDRMWNNDLLRSGKKLQVFLNDELQQRVLAYSIPGRFVKRHKMGADGRPVIEGKWEGLKDDRHIVNEIVHGVVRVEIIDAK